MNTPSMRWRSRIRAARPRVAFAILTADCEFRIHCKLASVTESDEFMKINDRAFYRLR